MKPPRHGPLNGYPRDTDGWPLCRYCGERCPSKRNTFCSAGCVAQWKIRSNPAEARAYVAGRDKGVCASCGTPTCPIFNELHELRSAIPFRAKDGPAVAAYDARAAELRDLGYGTVPLWERLRTRRYDWPKEGWFWQMDHITPVAHGGGMAGLDNLQTLCTPCHKKKTAEQAKARRKPTT